MKFATVRVNIAYVSEPKQSGFGAQMTERARRSNSSKRGLASAAGISESAWRQYEKGYRSEGGQRITRVPPARLAVRIAVVLDWDPVDALKTAGYDPDDHAHLLVEPAPVAPGDLTEVCELALVDELRRRIAGRVDRGGSEVRRLRPADVPEERGAKWAARRRDRGSQSDRDT